MSNEESPFKAIQDGVSKSLVNTTRTVSQIAQEDLTFQRTSNPAAMRQLEQHNARILAMAQNLTHQAVAASTVSKPKLKSLEGLEDNWRAIVDVVDSLLEKADACLDEFTGFIKHKPAADALNATDTLVGQAPNGVHLSRAFRDADLPKPQILFNKPTNNHALRPFRPLLQTKPHAIVPLEQSLNLNQDASQYDHPYQTEIKRYKFPPSIYTRVEPILYLPLDSTTANLVDTPEAVMGMLAELKQASVIAIDLEHHDKHSYIGLVSLMQISTRDKDWVVDTLKPWRDDLQVLNEVFTDPSIIKASNFSVLHGAFMDIIWLQRDFGLYVVGLFDTYHAASALHYPGKGLAYLLKRFAGFDAQKKYQMADWRIRPLPTDMFHYARCDTHFLLYVFDNMRNELLDSSNPSAPDGDLIQQVLEGSKRETLQVYEIPEYDGRLGTGPGGWYNQVFRTPNIFTKEQFAVFRALHSWRDHIAREEDESPTTLLSKAALFSISHLLPTDVEALRSCCRVDNDVFNRHSEELLKIIKNTKVSSQDEPDMAQLLEIHPETIRRAEAAAAWKETQETAATLQPAAPVESPPKENLGASIRSTLSRFWGGSLAQPNKKYSTHAGGNDELRLSIPLPKLNADVFETSETNGHSNSTPPSAVVGALAEHEYVKNRLQDRERLDSDVFLIRDSLRTKKRKREESERGEGTSKQQDSIREANQNAFENNQGIDRAEVIQERKALKARKKLEDAQQVASGVQQNGQEFQPFDYANAASVLHSKNETPGNGINPYTKSLNAPKGMRRANPELAGKSFTFKK